MFTFPKVDKGLKRAVTSLENVQKVIAGVTLTMGLLLTGPVPGAQADVPQQIQQQKSPTSGALLLNMPAQQEQGILSDHYSHYSHASHESHYSHYSHYSSRE